MNSKEKLINSRLAQGNNELEKAECLLISKSKEKTASQLKLLSLNIQNRRRIAVKLKQRGGRQRKALRKIFRWLMLAQGEAISNFVYLYFFHFTLNTQIARIS